jgi:signal transduction histidine kinase
MSLELEFKPKARLLLQLGDQLIKSESIALLEIVKNAYDANASAAFVSMRNLGANGRGEIVIEDDGDGMSLSIIKNVWMQPGSEHKEKILKSRKPSDKGRSPIGGKGIGRFGVHKLGHKIKLVSKMQGLKEVSIEINWRDFEQDKFLDDVKVTLTTNDVPTHFKSGKTGTRIVITDLKANWSRGSIRDLYRSVNSLNSPFQTSDAFRTYFKLDDQSWLKGLASFDEFKDQALYYAEALISGNEIKSLHYEFRPWNTMTKLQPREKFIEGTRIVTKQLNTESRKNEPIDVDLSKFDIGEVRLKLLIFDRSSKVLSLGVTDKKGLKEYLDANGGIRVFRDDIRVYDYGEPGNDWLNLDMMRVNQPGQTISNNLIIGAVDLIRSESASLIEKTNREGFIDNAAFRAFSDAISFTIQRILTQRNIDKDQLRKFYSPSAVNEPVLSKLKAIAEKIKIEIKDSELRDGLLRSLSGIEKDYQEIADIYMRSSSAGLSLSIVIHEIIHMISELALAVEQKNFDPHVKNLVKMLQRTAGDYADVIKRSSKSRIDLSKIIQDSLGNIQFRLRAHKVEIVSKFLTRTQLQTSVVCAKNLVTSTIINVIDNSIWWQEYGKVKKKKIFIDLIEYSDEYIGILIADNGPGFSIPPEDAIKPFISDKDGGMGLGLHLADAVMDGQKGKLMFPDPDDFELPDEFRNGAQVFLAFKRPK